jgi:hypothetical protein
MVIDDAVKKFYSKTDQDSLWGGYCLLGSDVGLVVLLSTNQWVCLTMNIQFVCEPYNV